jgi:hypothetical protein
MDVVGYTVDHMDVLEVFQPLTRKFAALKAPGYTVNFGTLAESVTTGCTVHRHFIREATLAPDLLQ